MFLQASRMDSLARSLSKGDRGGDQVTAIDAVKKLGRGLVKRRCERVLEVAERSPGQVHAAAMALSDADAESEEERGALVKYIIVVLIFLGLIGTFWGLLLTVSGVKSVLAGLDTATAGDTAAFIIRLKTSLDGLLGGMGSAFSASLFGLSSSVILGFVELQTRKARSRVLSDLDRFVITFLAPAEVDKEDPIVQGIQVVLEHHAGRLAKIMDRQMSADERIVELLGEIRADLSTAHREQSESRTADQASEGRMLQQLTELVKLQSVAGETMPAGLAAIKGLLERIDTRDAKEREVEREKSDHVRNLLQEMVRLHSAGAESLPEVVSAAKGLMEKGLDALSQQRDQHKLLSEQSLGFLERAGTGSSPE